MTRIALQPQCSRLSIQLRIRAPGVLGRAGLVQTLTGPDISVDVELFLSSSTSSIPDDLRREPERVHFDTLSCGWPRAGDAPRRIYPPLFSKSPPAHDHLRSNTLAPDI